MPEPLLLNAPGFWEGINSSSAIGYAAAHIADVIERHFPSLDTELVENLAIAFAYGFFVARGEH